MIIWVVTFCSSPMVPLSSKNVSNYFDQKLQVLCKQSITCARVLNVTYAVSNVIQRTPPEARVQNRHPETPLQNKSEQEWTCNLCEITGVGESMLNAHLRGSMHKSKLEFLRENDTRPLPSVTCQTQSASSFDFVFLKY